MSVYSAHEPLPRDIPIVQVGLVDNDLAKNFAAEIALKGDVRETLRVLVPAIKSAGGPSSGCRCLCRGGTARLVRTLQLG
jgi:benzoylformate decarboxylase